MQCARSGVRGLVRSALPEPSASHQVLVKVHAAGVNRPDVLQNAGLYPARPGITDVLGLEIAGTVAAGSGDEGEAVCALVNGGGYAEYCVAERALCLPVPFSEDDPNRMAKAAALPETVFTVWKNLFWNGKDSLRGKRVFVHGGSSGIGTTAVEMARVFGAKDIVATCRDDAKCAFVTETCGADFAYNYTDDTWWREARNFDVVLDMVGGDYLQKNMSVLGSNGRLVILGFLKSPISEKVNMTRLLLKSLTITGSVLRSASNELKANLCREIKEQVWPRILDGSLKLPHISKMYPLEDFEKAHQYMQDSNHCGKIVLQV